MISSALTWYKVMEKSQSKLEANFAKQPTVARDLKRFEEVAPKIKTVDDLMKDRRSLQVVLSAFQLESEIDKRALVKKILTEPVADEKALSNRMLDPRYKKLAAALQPLFEKGVGLSDSKAVESLVKGFKTNEFEKQQGEQATGMREVMYFKRTMKNVTSLAQIMSDKTLMSVVRTGLGFPKSFGALDYDQQKSRLESRVDVSKFQDPKFMDKFVQQFLIRNDQEVNGTQASPIVSLFQSSGSGGGYMPIGIDLTV